MLSHNSMNTEMFKKMSIPASFHWWIYARDFRLPPWCKWGLHSSV